jgi:glycosyltransferase involved in cell wall biosynthesis
LSAAGEPLRIAQVAPVAQPVRPGQGDSIEQLVALLCEGLVARGHRVTLFATGDSASSAEVRWLHARGYDDEPDLWDWQFRESMHAAFAHEQADEFDLLHCHDYHYPVPFTGFVHRPVVHTHHVEVDPEVAQAYARYPEAQLVAVSESQRAALPKDAPVEVISHGIDTAAFPFGEGGGDYLLFLGRLIADKGPRQAIEVARRAGMPLVLAGRDEEGIYHEAAASLGDAAVRYIGPVGGAERGRLLAGAAALLYPLAYPEPFGLVLAEAMACGTPVVAVGIGAVLEIVEEGVTGYTAPSWEELAELIPAARKLDRRRIRDAARRRFDHDLMVERHEALYRRVLSQREAAGR